MGSIICAIILIILGIVLIGVNKCSELSSLGITMIFAAGLILGVFINEPKIKPIDVYRGKTELKIKTIMEDSVIIKRDSTVVLKTK